MSDNNTSPPLVLIVDDNPLIVNVIENLLKAESYQVCVSNNGAEALKVLAITPVDVIICDVMMPTMDGYELHEKVRANPELSHIPFIFLTALSDDSEVIKGREAGADDYLCKPFDPRNLLAIVKGKVKRARVLKAQFEDRYNTYRKKVVHTLSHEFRTPLVAINTGSELLLDSGASIDPNKAKSLLEAIRRGGQRLERLVSDFMLLQQLEAGISERLVASRSQVISINRIVERYVRVHSEEVAAEGCELALSIDDCEHFSRVYEPYITDILGRLINNAIKFKRADKKIDIRLSKRGDFNVIEVRDHGVGIDLVKARDAMQAFAQIDRDRYEQQGSGIGLALSNRYAGLHGGKIELSENDGGGAVVSLLLPIVNPE